MASCGDLYEQCKDLHQGIINGNQYIQKLKAYIQQQSQVLNGMGIPPKVQEATQHLAERSEYLSNMRAQYASKMIELINTLAAGRYQLCGMQSELINIQLDNFKTCQMKEQVGEPLENKDEQIRQLQQKFEMIAAQNIELRQSAAWMIHWLETTNDDQDKDYCMHLDQILAQLEQMFVELVCRSVNITEQPDAVLKTNHKIGTEVRLLLAEKLGIEPQLNQARVTVKIIYEEAAQQLVAGTIQIAKVKEVGKISIPTENMDQRKRSVTFKNSKLTSVEKRNQPIKAGAKNTAEGGDDKLAAARKYALLFQFSSLDIGTRLGKIDLWTLSNPLMVTVHTSQVCLAHAAISWHHAFGPVNRNANVENMTVSCHQMIEMLKNKFSHFTGARRALSESDLNYLLSKMLGQAYHEQSITYNQFAEKFLPDGNFPFWKWFYAVMELIKGKLIDFWNEGYLVGFISKTDASERIMSSGAAQPTCILRFSDSILGSVSIGFWGQVEVLHLQPFTGKDLDDCSLLQRIMTCPQLAIISHVYPNKLKEQMRQRLEYIESQRQQGKPKAGKTCQNNPNRYIKHTLAMVADTSGTVQQQHLPALVNAMQPSPAAVVPVSPSFSTGSFTNPTSPNDAQGSVEDWMAAGISPEEEFDFSGYIDFEPFLDPNMNLDQMELGDLDDVLSVIAKHP